MVRVRDNVPIQEQGALLALDLNGGLFCLAILPGDWIRSPDYHSEFLTRFTGH